MSPERAPSRVCRPPAPELSLQALLAIGDHVIAAWPYWFAGRARRLDQLLDQHGYVRESRIAWERYADDRYSVAMTRSYDRDSDQVVHVAVVGIAAFHDLYGGPARAGSDGGAVR